MLIWLIIIINSRRIATPRKSQMIQVINSDFLSVAGAMTSSFFAIEKNQAWAALHALKIKKES